jgi:REP element-mobilizing transposase RayT
MSEHVLKRHNKTLLLYHLVCPAKYRRDVFTAEVSKTLQEVCRGIEERYEIGFHEIGTDEDHVHFLIQSIPDLAPSRIVQIVKSITARMVFARHPDVKKKLWGGEFWTKGYYMNTVGQFANEKIIATYVKNQGRIYQPLYRGQPTLFGTANEDSIPRSSAAG